MDRDVFAFGLSIAFVFVFLNSAAFAQNFELQVAPSAASVCSCSSITTQNVQISITNFLPYPDTYTFTVTTPAGFTSQMDQKFVVNQGDTRKFTGVFIISVGCFVLPGEYDVVISAKSGSTGEVQTKTISVEVLNCYEVQVSLDSKYRDMCTEENTSSIFYVTVQNNGKYSDTFDLSASVSWAAFSDTPITIDAGKSKTVAFALTPPAGTKGVQLVNIYVKSKQFSSSDMETIQLNIQDCYSMAANLQPSELSICLGEIATQKLTISNTGTKSDSYSVIVPNWVTVDKPVASVDAKKSADVTITLQPGQTGKASFNVTAVSAKDPNENAVIQTSVNVNDCRGVAVIVTPSSSYACQGTESVFSVNVKNLGSIQDTFNLTATSGVLDSSKVVIGPKGTAELKLTIPNITTPGTYNITIKAESSGISDESTVTVVVDNCYSASMDISPQNASVCSGAIVNYTIAVKNTGKLSDNYTLVVGSEVANLTRQFTLDSGQVRMEYFAVQVPNQQAEQNYMIMVTLQSSRISAQSQSILTVKPESSCYSVDIVPETEAKLVQICNATVMPVVIKNTGEKRDSFNLTLLDAPQWAYLSPNIVDLSGGQDKTVYIYFSPCFGVDKKVYDMTIRVVSSSSQVQKQIAVGVVDNITTAPSGNQTGGTGGNITGNLILGLDNNQWKLAAIILITVIIIAILAVRFMMLARK